MYNRYTPQSDGSYRRDKVPDHAPQIPPRPHPQTPPYYPPPPEVPPCPSPQEAPPCPQQPTPCPPPHYGGISGFLRQLLPQNFDTGDLLIILLLLLMAGDSEDEKGTALLTLAFYLFM